MNAQALIGSVLGTCTLQKLVGQGGMGAVYLAQQSRPRRQVAVKVLLPATTLKPHQLAAFLERFRRETDAAASLEHPNIVPVHEYGEQDGLAYLVMPYISGGTLRDVMEREGALALPKVVSYLEQVAAALDFAHDRGIIHRDIKPANILLTPNGRALLTDFGLVKIISEGPEGQAQVRLTGPGAPVGTPDYMAPEQVLGEEVDGRADLYSLAVILYQMVTGIAPFQGVTPMQIAVQQLQKTPASPCLLRPDLPPAAEQVILRALAKSREDRYARGQDFAAAFRAAVQSSQPAPVASQQVTVQSGPLLAVENTAAQQTGGAHQGVYQSPSRGPLDPGYQTGSVPAFSANAASTTNTPPTPTRSSGLLSRTGMFPSIGALPPANIDAPTQMGILSEGQVTMNQPPLGTFPNQMSPILNANTMTGALEAPAFDPGSVSTIKLTGPMKVVQVPVAGQPGQYVTGLLPVPPEAPAVMDDGMKKLLKLVGVAALITLLLLTSGIFLWTRSHPAPTSTQGKTTALSNTGAISAKATAAAQVTATAQANIILTDPLNQNIHNWPTSPSNVYTFTGGAYHITDRGTNGIAVVLQESPFVEPIAYSLTMEEIQGDDTSPRNSFGMVIRYTEQNKDGQGIITFYSFEVVNTPGGEYRFYKYDNSQGPNADPWTELWHSPFGNEFHQGQGHVNTFRIYANGSSFRFTVNGKSVGSTTDTALKSGTVGMLVNLDGTEIAFSNMLITHK